MTVASDQPLTQAVAHHRAGRLVEAERLYQEILRADPRQIDVLQYLGLIAMSRGETKLAVERMREAVAIRPAAPQCRYNLGLALRRSGDAAGAIENFREAIRLAPGYAEFHSELGSALRESGDARAAVAPLERAIAIRPGLAIAHLNLGAVYLVLGEMARAEPVLRRAFEMDAELVDALVLLGNMYRSLEQHDRAAAEYLRALERKPDQPVVLMNLGFVLQAIGRMAEAVAYLERARALNPGSVDIISLLGNAYFLQGDAEQAIRMYREALRLNPGHGPTFSNLGAALQKTGRIEEAIAAYRTALRGKAEPDMYNNLGLALAIFGAYGEAEAQFRHAMELRPDFIVAYRNMLSTLLYDPHLTADRYWTTHAAFGQAMASRVTSGKPKFANTWEPERCVRIGYLSSDLHAHPIGRNLMPVLEHHDRAGFEVTAYAEVARPDATTEKLKGMVDRWRPTVGLSDAQLAEQIRADGIDILVLLGGHFDHNRPQIASWRAAPVQVSFHDPATSGIGEMDYLIADRVLAPRNSPERFSERVVRLPSFYIHAPLSEAPNVGALPAAANGHVTFGSFNNPSKVNDTVLQLWGEVLRTVPGSRLALKFKNWFGNGGLRERVLKGLGVEETRVEFRVGESGAGEHLDLYGGIDIALDPFPFTGSTTTFEALWMGVPVVTLLGGAMAGRWSASMLHALKLDELIAMTPDEYVGIAAKLANDRERLGALRQGLRDRVASSPLCDGRARARQVDRLYRALWRRWCKAA